MSTRKAIFRTLSVPSTLSTSHGEEVKMNADARLSEQCAPSRLISKYCEMKKEKSDRQVSDLFRSSVSVIVATLATLLTLN